MEHLLQKSKCSIFHNIFKYVIFQSRQKASLWSNRLKLTDKKSATFDIISELYSSIFQNSISSYKNKGDPVSLKPADPHSFSSTQRIHVNKEIVPMVCLEISSFSVTQCVCLYGQLHYIYRNSQFYQKRTASFFENPYTIALNIQ